MSTPIARIERLRRIAQANISQVNYWKEGVDLEKTYACSVQDVIRKAAVDRWRLARRHRSEADKLLTFQPPQYRSAISRFYYAMYHAMRACAYLFHEGDDYEKHADLPQNIPNDFPDKTCRQVLKNARLARNMADYDPYPGAGGWRKQAVALQSQSHSLLIASRKYLRSRGCKIS